MEEEKLKRRIVVEEAMPKEKKKVSMWPAIIFLLLLCAIAFVVLEKLKYIDFVDFI